MIWQPKENQTVYNLDVAYGIVREQLAKADVRRQCERSGAELQADGSVVLNYLNQPYRIDVSRGTVSSVADNKAMPLRESILLLHYFTQAKGTPLAHNQITYRDMPGGLVYYPTFTKRTIEPLVEYFGERPPLLDKAAGAVGGVPGHMGDSSLEIPAFPHVPVIIIIWRSDGELPPGGNLVFDSSITDYLESEDVTVVCETITWRLVNCARSL